MGQLVGLNNGIDQVRNNLVRPPILTVAAAAYADGRIMKPTNATYAQQTVQVTDDLGNAASHVRIANGGYRTVQRVINTPLNGDAIKTVRLPNNVGSGTLSFTRIDGIGAPTGFLKLLDDRDLASVFIMSPGMSIGIDANMHRVSFRASGADANSYVSIMYAMECYIANIVFDTLPVSGDLITFGDFAIFQFYLTGETDPTGNGTYGVEIGIADTIEDVCDSLVTAFNTAYVDAIEPAHSQVPYHWARKIDANDLLYYKDTSSNAWLIATDAGVQFCSTNAAMIRNITTSMVIPDAQVSKQL